MGKMESATVSKPWFSEVMNVTGFFFAEAGNTGRQVYFILNKSVKSWSSLMEKGGVLAPLQELNCPEIVHVICICVHIMQKNENVSMQP